MYKGPNEHWVDSEGVMHIQLPHDKEALIDAADWPLVRDHRWCSFNTHSAQPTHRPSWRVQARTRGVHHYIYHLLIGKPPKGMVVDHINGDQFDNRRCNLHFATFRENALNSVRSLSNVREPALLRVS